MFATNQDKKKNGIGEIRESGSMFFLFGFRTKKVLGFFAFPFYLLEELLNDDYLIQICVNDVINFEMP